MLFVLPVSLVVFELLVGCRYCGVGDVGDVGVGVGVDV